MVLPDAHVLGAALLAEALAADGLIAHDGLPASVVRRVEIDPRDKAVARLLREPHTVVSLVKHHHQLRRVCMPLHRLEEVDVALNAWMAHEPDEVEVRHGELATELLAHSSMHPRIPVGEHAGAAQIWLPALVAEHLRLRRIGLVVAADAEGVEDGLDLAGELEVALRAAPRAYLLERDVRGDAGRARDEALLLVASGAGEVLSAACREPAAHHLHGLALRVKRLDGDGRIRGDLEICAAVGIHRHGAERAAHVPRAVEPDRAVESALVLESECVGVEAEVLHRAGGDALQARALVDIGDVDLRLLGPAHRAVGPGVRDGRLHERHGFAEIVPILAQKAKLVVEAVDDVDGKVPLAIVPARHEEGRVVKRERVEVHRPRAIVELVAHDGVHWLAVARHELHGALALLGALRDIEEPELALPAKAMVSGQDSDELRGLARYRARVEHAVWPEGVAPVERALVRPVGIAREEYARVGVREVGVFPSQVHDAPVRHHLRTPGVLLVVAKKLHLGAVRPAAEEVRDRRRSPNAWNSVLERGTGEDDVTVRNVAGIVVIDVRRVVARHLANLARREIQLHHVPGVGCRDAGEEQAVGVPVEFDVHQRASARRLVQHFGCAAPLRLGALAERGADVQDAEFIVVSVLGENRVALPVARKMLAVVAAADEEELVERDGGVEVDHQLALDSVKRLQRLFRSLNGTANLLYTCRPTLSAHPSERPLRLLEPSRNVVELRRKLRVRRPAVRNQAFKRRKSRARRGHQRGDFLATGELARLNLERAASLAFWGRETALRLEAHRALRHGQDQEGRSVSGDEPMERLAADLGDLRAAPVDAVELDLAPARLVRSHL